MSPNERFEIVAEVFYRRTGLLRPGKDVPMANESAEEERHESWKDFNAVYGDVIRETMEVCDRWFVRQYDPDLANHIEEDERWRAERLAREQEALIRFQRHADDAE